MKTKILFAALALAALSARAEFFDGNKLLQVCESRSDIDFGDCIGYVTGVHDALQHVELCPPAGVTRGQVRDVVVLWLRANPAQRHRAADMLVREALRPLWPCQPPPSNPAQMRPTY